ncbi:PaaI family thioesterase [Tritonibacter horizontis]|uniref:Thioesterase superfamily protein n=1 Tax=Tritonibacter horizontis TaxID=1768241 RepID=A0A132C2E4_9RHOB|nr:PaaI family thioesterase [Tritonibacter horizontis]KUP94422.1 thioesterase superfamily protein [Tritonibacter horizontis]
MDPEQVVTTDQPEHRILTDPGCQQLVGYETRIDATGACTVRLEVQSQHLNRHGILHGGMVATVMDVACGNTASQYFDPLGHAAVVTVALNLSYIAATGPGSVIATARPTGGGKSTVHVYGELHDGQGSLLATATGVFRRIGRR